MKVAICFAALSAFCGVCANSGVEKMVADAEQVMEYQVRGNQYAVVVALDGVDSAKAKKMAMQRAAEITVQSGGRYFTVDKTERVQVAKSGDAWPNSDAFYGNMYQELIVEDDFGKDQTQGKLREQGQVYPAHRLVFTIYTTKPRGQSVDACTLVNCH